MTLLLTIQNKLPSLLKTGSRLLQNRSPPLSEEDDQSVKWDDVFSAFERRIRSGVISNLTHMDIISFMKDAQIVFESKITKALKVYNAIKVNTELAAEYIIHKSDSVDAKVKYFNTQNAPMHKVTDLKQWFDVNVKQAVQREMEEFQE